MLSTMKHSLRGVGFDAAIYGSNPAHSMGVSPC
jgi:hypothetical protein